MTKILAKIKSYFDQAVAAVKAHPVVAVGIIVFLVAVVIL